MQSHCITVVIGITKVCTDMIKACTYMIKACTYMIKACTYIIKVCTYIIKVCTYMILGQSHSWFTALSYPFKKPSAGKSFAPLLNAHPLKGIISSKSSPLLVVVQPLQFSKSLKVRQKRGAWAMYNYIHVIIHGKHVYVDKQNM